MQWASSNLPHEYYYSSCDDDFMLDVAVFEDIINWNIKNTERRKWPLFPFICVFGIAKPHIVRVTYNKYFVPYDEFSWDAWPRSCLGGFYSSQVATISKVWDQSKNEILVRMDDVWVTGVLRLKIGMPDYAVIDPETKAAHHFYGFNGKGSPRDHDFMENEWKNYYNSISKREHCFCRY